MSDQDSASSQAVNDARVECGERRPSDWQYCYQHVLKGSHRLLNKSMNLKGVPAESGSCADSNPVDPNLPFACSRCSKGFKTNSGRSTHIRYCRVEPSAKRLSMSKTWLEQNDISAKEVKPFKKKLLHWLLMRKNAELKRGVAAWKNSKCYQGKGDLELKNRLKKAAGTILPCLKGDHSICIQYSFVCIDCKDPFLSFLPHKRNVSSLPDTVQRTISESIWSLFGTDKLNRLIIRGALRTTSLVEATHRTIRNPAPKGKPLQKNQTAVLQSGAMIAACRGRGLANLRHFRRLGLSVSSQLANKMRALDRSRRKAAARRSKKANRERSIQLRRQKMESRGRLLETKEAEMYRKEAFSDHNYSQPATRLAGEL